MSGKCRIFELRSRSALPLATEGTQEDRLHLTFGRPLSRLGHRCTHHGSRCSIGSEAKINRDLFCVSLDLHYLCAVNSAKFFDLKVQSAKEILTLDI